MPPLFCCEFVSYVSKSPKTFRFGKNPTKKLTDFDISYLRRFALKSAPFFVRTKRMPLTPQCLADRPIRPVARRRRSSATSFRVSITEHLDFVIPTVRPKYSAEEFRVPKTKEIEPFSDGVSSGVSDCLCLHPKRSALYK